MNKYLKHNTLYFLLVCLIVTFSACTEKITLDLGSTYTRLVVDGAISSDTMAHVVRLSTTTDFFYTQSPPPVSNATVSISDGEQVFLLTEDPLQPGYYKTGPDVYGIPGKQYTLHVELQEAINGHQQYEAACRMNPVASLDSIRLFYRETWKAWEIQCFAWDPPSVNFYMFNIFKNGILITDTIHKVMVTNDILFNGSYTNGVGVGYLQEEYPREIVYPGDVITLQIASISREYLDFIWSVQTETGYKNPLISGPPANISSNISNGAMGFFAAYATAYASTVAK